MDRDGQMDCVTLRHCEVASSSGDPQKFRSRAALRDDPAVSLNKSIMVWEGLDVAHRLTVPWGAPCKRSRKYVLERVRTRRTATGVPLTLKTRSTSFLSLCPSDFARPLSSFATNVKTSSARSNNVLGACCSSPWRSYHLFTNSSSSSPLTSALSRKISRLSLNPSTPAFSRMPDTARIHSPKLSKTLAVPLGHPESIQCCTMDKAADGVTHVSIDRMYRAAQKWTRWAVSMTRWK